MTRLRCLLLGSLLPPPDFWGRAFWKLAEDLRDRGLDLRLLMPGASSRTERGSEFERRGLHGRRVPAVPTRKGSFRDLFRSREAEENLAAFLEREQREEGPFGFALIHRWRGFPLNLPGLLQAAGIPTLCCLPEAWPLCPRRDLCDAKGEPCTRIDPLRCLPCLRATWPPLLPGEDDPGTGFLGERIAGPLALCRSLKERALAELEQPELCLVPSPRLRGALVESGVPARRLHRIESFEIPEPLPRKPRSPRCVLGFLGELRPGSGLDLLLDALRRAEPKDFALQVAGPVRRVPGSGSWLAATFARIPASLDFRYLGPMREGRLLSRIARLDALFCPEGLTEPTRSLSRLALHSGRFLLASDLSDAALDIVPGRNGAIFRHGDPSDLARRLRELASLRDGRGVFEPPPPVEGDLVSTILEIAPRLPLPFAGTNGVSYWSPHLDHRVFVAQHPSVPGERLAYPLRWEGERWVAAANPRQISDPQLVPQVLGDLLPEETKEDL